MMLIKFTYWDIERFTEIHIFRRGLMMEILKGNYLYIIFSFGIYTEN